ncbi:MAG TPA: UDP-4-amino-4-deoxy-L-arabinose aminotransferase [Desulfobulbaceae bacterium]|nr:UDP-4-amino-4-deoxy-L-arabinose aminotransferase [Desulfobulbaceae bacterium]
MRSEFLPFSKPSISEAEIGAVADVLRSGWITTGAKAAAFEEAFADYCGTPGAVALASATAGMHLLLAAMGIGPGDEVITPSLTWVSTVNLIQLAGAKPVFADIDRDTLMVSAETIAPLISERTRLIIPVHYAGAAADLEPLRQLAAAHNIPLIEDAAHAAGTEYRGEKIGRRGTTIFSFHPIKNITCGEGGMFCSDDASLLEHIRRLKFHGLGVDAFDRSMQGRSPQAEVIEPGFKYNLTDMAAVLGLGQLNRLDEFNKKRTALAERYLELLADIPEVLPLGLPDYPMRHAWHLFVVRLDSDKTAMTRDEFMARLKERNIGTGIHFKAAHRQRYYRETLGLPEGVLPNTEWNSDRLCSLPLFPDMNMEDVDDVAETIKEVLV